MKSKLRERAIKLRTEEELSYSQIKKKLGVPKSTLSYWLREYPLSEERIKELQRKGWKKAEAKIERYRNSMRKKKELKRQKVYNKYRKRFAELSKEDFFTGGLMLYLGEGNKANHTRIVLSNTDPKIIKFFIKWMVEFLNVSKRDMKAQLHLYENMDIEKEKEFWRKELGFQKDQFYKPEIRELTENSFCYEESFRHGTCALYLLSVEKTREVTEAIRAFLDKFQEC